MNAPVTIQNGVETIDVAALLRERDALRAQLAQANKPRTLSLKVSEKGAVSLYGMGRFPVTLYGQQWERLLNEADTIRAFLKTNAALLSVKEAK